MNSDEEFQNAISNGDTVSLDIDIHDLEFNGNSLDQRNSVRKQSANSSRCSGCCSGRQMALSRHEEKTDAAQAWYHWPEQTFNCIFFNIMEIY